MAIEKIIISEDLEYNNVHLLDKRLHTEILDLIYVGCYGDILDGCIYIYYIKDHDSDFWYSFETSLDINRLLEDLNRYGNNYFINVSKRYVSVENI